MFFVTKAFPKFSTSWKQYETYEQGWKDLTYPGVMCQFEGGPKNFFPCHATTMLELSSEEFVLLRPHNSLATAPASPCKGGRKEAGPHFLLSMSFPKELSVARGAHCLLFETGTTADPSEGYAK